MVKLRRYFSIASLLSIAVATITLSMYYRSVSLRELMEMGEHQNVEKTIMMSNMFGTQLVAFRNLASVLDPAEIRSHPVSKALDTEVRRVMHGHDVVKVKIYDMAGKTIYSSDPAQIGEDKSRNGGFVAARSGHVASELTHRDTFSAFEQMVKNRDLLSSYVPMRDPVTGTIEGVFELYNDVTVFLDK